jgi:hypothetical protein
VGFRISFPFSVRQAMIVANAAATDIAERQGCNLKGLPSILSISGSKEAPIFRYEGGTVVQVHLVNLRSKAQKEESWAVSHLTVRHYPEHIMYSAEKLRGVWQAPRLVKLRNDHGWHHPHIVQAHDDGTWEHIIYSQIPHTSGEVYTVDLAEIVEEDSNS